MPRRPVPGQARKPEPGVVRTEWGLRRSPEIGGQEDGARVPLRARRDLDEVGDGIHAGGFSGLDEAVHCRGDDGAARGLGPKMIPARSLASVLLPARRGGLLHAESAL